MEPKFIRYIRFNGLLIVAIACWYIFEHALAWIAQLRTEAPYGYASSTLRNHLVVEGFFLFAWILAAAALYQAVQLELPILLYPIGYLFGLEALIVAVQDVIYLWHDDAEERFLRNRRDVIGLTVVLLYFYYTLYTLGKLFERKDRAAMVTKALTAVVVYPLVTTQDGNP